jgi:uncharacterized protein DUF664
MSGNRPNTTGTERETLQELLDDNRQEIIRLLDGLTEEQARRRLVPSLTTPLALVKHAAFAEQIWFHVTLPSRSRDELGLPWDTDDTFRPGPEETIASVVAEFRAVCAESDRIAASYSLDDTGSNHRLGKVSLRWMYVHMIEELARHAGHGDILREQILAADGEA